ncbi:MAG: acyltransferase [Sphingomonas bacterium]
MESIPHRASDGRNASVDVFRGLLVLLVMLGHFSELSQRQNFLTWLGFGFRMPVFIGLTGYLFNLEQARSMRLPALFEKYYGRLILPWLVACAVHLALVGAMDQFAPLSAVFRPPFHLWFVPVMVAFIFAARACRLDPTRMLAIAVPASIAAMYIFGVGYNIEQYHAWVPDRRYFIYPIYFTFGMWVARRPFDPSLRNVPVLIALIGLFWWCRLYDHPLRAGEVAAELILCVPLILLLPRIRQLDLNLPLIASVGRDSLFVYLWHPLVFGLWASQGVYGFPLLALSLMSMLVAGAVIARVPSLRDVLGVRAADPPAGTEPKPAHYAPSPELAAP